MKYLSFTDFIFLPFVLALIYYFSRLKRNKNIEKFPEFKYYIPGLAVKIFGAIALAFIYTIYYAGGDTVNYFHDAVCWNKLFFTNPQSFFMVFKDGVDYSNYFYFGPETGYPIYFRDTATVDTVRFAFLTTLLSFRSFIVSSVLFAWFSYMGVWRLYRVFLYEFPMLAKPMAIAVLFIPSVFFWGSGMLKDTVTFSAVGFFTFNFYMIFIKRKGILSHSIGIVLSSYIILAIKPYIIFAFIPGCLLWIINSRISKFGGSFTRAVATPVFLTVAILAGYILLLNMSNQLGQYSLDNVLNKAVVTQQDLKRDYYQGNSFDIGDIEANVPSMLSKAHLAINASLFRPYLWECKNPVMFLSGIENFFILILTIIVLIKIRVVGIFKYFVKHHLLTFALVFSLFFAFSVGISTSNFGSMVRYKIPILPFYVASLFIIRYYHTLSMPEKAMHREKELAYIKPQQELAVTDKKLSYY